MLDQRLLRNDPTLITGPLARRCMATDLSGLRQLALEARDLEQRRSELQAEGNRIGKEVGERIRGRRRPGRRGGEGAAGAGQPHQTPGG